MKKSTITFCGGAGHVTGANFFLEVDNKKVLIDCGMVQGGAKAFLVNYEDFLYDPSDIDVLIVTHAHADHIGLIPKLVSHGFTGTIFSTKATFDLSKIMLPDSLKVSSIQAKKYELQPLYTQQDISDSFALWHTYPYHTPFEPVSGLEVEFYDAGHILGSAIVKVRHSGKTFVFTGDLGNTPAPLLRDTEIIDDADYLLMESVYGDRNHEGRDERTALLRKAIEDARKTGGTLLIPAFAMQRTQIILHEINNMVESGEIEPLPVYLDSPLAIKTTDIFNQYTEQFNARIQKELETDDNIFAFPQFKMVRDARESAELVHMPGPKIIISASGMSAGGRILMHERKLLGDKRNIILFVGYQAVGTVGRQIQDGNKVVNIEKKQVRVRARVRSIRGFSAHKDSDNLVEFVSYTAERVKKVFVTMGEARSSLFLVQRLREFLGVDAIAPERGEKIEIDF